MLQKSVIWKQFVSMVQATRYFSPADFLFSNIYRSNGNLKALQNINENPDNPVQ